MMNFHGHALISQIFDVSRFLLAKQKLKEKKNLERLLLH